MKASPAIAALFLFHLSLFAYEADDADTLTNLQEMAAAGNTDAQSNLANSYWANLPEKEHWDYANSASATNRASRLRYETVCKKCAFWANKAARSGDLPSIYLLGLLQFERGMTNRNEEQGRSYLLYAATHDYTLAQEEYGKVLYHGLGGSTNWVEVAAFFRFAESSYGDLTVTNKVLFANIQSRLNEQEHLKVSRYVSNLHKIIDEQKSVKTPQYLTDDYIFNKAQKAMIQLSE